MSLFDPKNGYYQVGNGQYLNKVQALKEGTRTGKHPEWIFNNNVYAKVPWGVSTSKSLQELYKNRAQQLRDKYDYLVLNYSGGSDSYTALHSFFANGIHLDEVWTSWPLEITKGKYTPSKDKHPSNILSEWDFTISKNLNYIKQHHPEIKIKVNDWSSTVLEKTNEHEDFLYSQYLNHANIKRAKHCFTEFNNVMQAHKSSALILGLDKPQMVIKDDTLYTYFLDKLCGWVSDTTGILPRNIEYFYWTPDMPEIVQEQTFLIYMHLILNTNAKQIFEGKDKTIHDPFIRSICYPDWVGEFQADKPYSCAFDTNYSWLMEHYTGSDNMNSWGDYLFKGVIYDIDQKYLEHKNGIFDSFVGMVSPFYKIGKL